MVATTESVADHNHYQAITIQYFEGARRQMATRAHEEPPPAPPPDSVETPIEKRSMSLLSQHSSSR